MTGGDGLCQRVTGEPILGPRQAALIDAYTARLHAGYPLTLPDLAAYLNTAQILGLGVVQARAQAEANTITTVPPQAV
jgi:hypothetical protein